MIIKIGVYTEQNLLIDEEDYNEIMKVIKPLTAIRPLKGRNRYYCDFTHKNETKILVHRFILNPKDEEIVDHIDGNSLNNQRNNLRISTYSRNMINRRAFAGFKTTTKLHHISYKKRANSFYVRIVKDKVEYSKGGFKTLEEAIEYHKKLLPQLFPVECKTIFEQNGYAENEAKTAI